MTQIIIGITGRKGSGKSTLANLLAAEIEGAEIIAFADALRDDVIASLSETLSAPESRLRPWLEARKATVFGPILQGWGSLMREWYGQDYWLEIMVEAVEDRCGGAVIIPDVRYENEAEMIRARDGVLVSIEGPSRWVGDQRDTSHPSETTVDKIRQLADTVISNDSDMAHLTRRAVFIAEKARLFAAGESIDR